MAGGLHAFEPGEAARMRIATLNAWGLPKLFADDVSARIREIGRRLPRLELDAIAFQEVWTDRAQERLVGAGAAAGLVHAWHGASGLRGSGLLALSRFPIEGVRFEPYDLRGVPSLGDFYGGKGFAELRLATPSGPLTLVDTHLLARYTNDVPHEYRAQRVGQIVELASGLAEVRTPLLVAGDFNLDSRHEEYAVLLGLTGTRDSAAEVDAHVPTVFRGNPYRAGSRSPTGASTTCWRAPAPARGCGCAASSAASTTSSATTTATSPTRTTPAC
jgi:endonuclease/exonuclease/phosphatase family metal-dependent hydrolase